jgi:isochorismate hydrolase
MKEMYFSAQTIERQSNDLLKDIQIAALPKKSEFKSDNSALLVLDMQKFFLYENNHAFIPSAAAIIPGINKLIAFYKRMKLPIVFTKHINTKSDAGMMSQRWRDIITEDNPLSEITSELDKVSGTVIAKSQYDAFYETDLKKYLVDNNVHRLVITGVMTHLCCETTARSGFINGFEVFFPVEGTATYNLNFHRASLLNLAHGFAEIVLVKDILEGQKF